MEDGYFLGAFTYVNFHVFTMTKDLFINCFILASLYKIKFCVSDTCKNPCQTLRTDTVEMSDDLTHSLCVCKIKIH